VANMRPNGAFQGSQASDGADGKNRGSKQKIIQLKDELNGGSLQINPKFEKLKVLRESYDIAKFRANELLLPHDQNLYLKAHGLRASKIYSALSTLIFVSISCSKVEELEDYVMKSAAQVPSTIFDLEEWSSIVKIAKDCREGDSNSLREQVSALKKNMSVYNQLAANPLKAAQMELKLLRSEVMNELGGAQTDLAGSINLMMQLARELSGGSGTDVGESARRLSKLLHATDHHDKQAETAKNEELEALRVYQKDASEQLHKLHAESADLKAQLGAATSRADSAEAQNEQLVTNVSDLAHEIDAVKAAVAASPRHISSEQQAQQARDFQELYEQYSHLSATLQQRDQHILDLQDQIKGGSLKKRMDEEEQEPVPTPTPQIQIDLENQVSVLTQYVTELEHEMLKEKEKIKSLSTEVRLTEAARCEAAGYAETASQDLMYAKEDIFSLQAEIAGLRAALHAHSEHSADRGVSVPKGVSPRALSSPMGSFSALRIDTRRASFDTIVEVKEEDEGVNVMSNDDMSLVTEAPLDTPSISPMGGASMRSVRTELPGEPVKEEEPAERATPSDEDGRIITAEAEHTATSAIFIGKMQVALLQEEFAHHPPQAPAPEESQVPVEEEAAEDPTRELVGETEGIVVSAIEPTTDSIVEHEHVAEHIAEPVVEPVVELEEAKAPEQIEADLHSEVSLEVGTLLPPDGSGDDLNSSDNDARLIADEAARLAHSAVFLGAVHVAVMQDEFVSHSRPQSVPPPEEGMPPQTAEVTLTEDTAVLVPTALEVSDPIVETPADASVVTEVEKQEEIPSSEAPSAATTEEPSESNVQAGDAQLIAAEASRVAASAVFLGAVHVAVLQDEFAHHGQTAPQADPSVPETLKDVLETPIEARAEAKPESEVEITIITPEQLLPVESAAPLGANDGDAALIAAEAAHTAASALFLGAVHVAVMQEEFHQHPHSASNDGRDSAVVEEAPVVVEKAASAEASLESVVVENVSENVLEPQSVPVENLTANADQDIIADEAAKLVNATVFLGAVHVAVMKDEFSHHAPAVELPVIESEPERIAEDPVALANEAPAPSLSPGAKQVSAPVLSEPETQKTESDHTVEAQPEAPSTEPAETLPFPVADESAPVADDAQIISDEAARTVASSVFLGAMHVAVMQDEFTHLPQHSSPTDVVEIKSTEDSAPPTEDVDIGSSAEVAVAAVEDPPVETPLEQLVPTSSDPSAEDSQIIAAEAAHTTASALFLGTVHVAVMQDEFSNSHVAAPVTDAGESAAVDVSLETEATETRPAKEMDPESARLTSPASVARVESASKVDIATHDMPAPVEEDKAAVVPEESGKIEPVLTQELSVAEDPAAVNETAAEAAPVEEAEPIGEVQAVDMTSGPEAPPVKVETTDEEIPPPPAESPSESVTTITGPSEADIPHAELSPVETVVDSAPADGEVHAEGETSKEESTVSVPDPRSEGNEASVKMDVVVATTSSKKEAPAAPWDIVAAKGTEQGKSGWYTDKGQLFYYCEDKVRSYFPCYRPACHLLFLPLYYFSGQACSSLWPHQRRGLSNGPRRGDLRSKRRHYPRKHHGYHN